ncbi:MAG: 3-dehydroquinate synthase [Acidobacteriaceae bacterium]|nr:3-dehydroquinate synthase [Acidobacteriaceae bacterium]
MTTLAAAKKVSINVQPHPYEALIESGSLHAAGEHILRACGDPHSLFVITNGTVRKHWGNVLSTALDAAKLQYQVIDMGDGERHKSIATIEDLATKLLRRGADRKSTIVAFGGGVVGDAAGFLASIYMRGIRLVQIPTTFLAQVDASIGGKTGVNLPSGKNLLGTFHQPRLVLIDPAVLATLPEREYRAGLYEALKCGVIRNREIFEFMERQRESLLRRDAAALDWLIAECVKVKADVVAADERESDLRRILNFGHTVGHALEAETSYKQYLHGEAVAWGMIAATMIAAALQKADTQIAQRIISLVLAYASLPPVAAHGKNIVRRLRADKKTTDGVVHFVLPRAIGEVEIVADVPDKAVVQAVEEIRTLSAGQGA